MTDYTQLVEEVKLINTISNLADDFIDRVVARLDSFGYELDASDAFAIAFAIQKAVTHIFNYCNIISVPSELEAVAIDMTCGEFFTAKRSTNSLNIATLDMTSMASTIKTGDTSVSFDANSSDDAKFKAFIDYLLNGREGDLICFRKLRW